MNTAQVEYIGLSNERILENKTKADGITRKSSLYKNISLILFVVLIMVIF